MYPAAATGILTALLAAESSDGTETVENGDGVRPAFGGGYKSINLKAGELITMSDCIKAMLLVGQRRRQCHSRSGRRPIADLACS